MPTPNQTSLLVTGEGPAIVFVPAFPFPGSMWTYQVEALSSSWRCATVDIAGFGAAPAPVDPSACTIESYADDLASAIQSEFDEPVVLVGSSLGGQIATSLAARHPELLRGLVLSGVSARADTPASWQKRTKWQQRVVREDEDFAALGREVIGDFLTGRSLEREDLVEWLVALAADSEPDGWVGALEATKRRGDMVSLLAAITARTLVVVGQQDRQTPPMQATLLNGRIENSDLVQLPDAGHLPAVEDPVTFNEKLESFLAQFQTAEVADVA
ncbi:MAG: alpha/beta fold hydrolase [Actinomycetota bacterium]|nr:alpha/beta fold hydrolase [Actinomycetota bacterium]